MPVSPNHGKDYMRSCDLCQARWPFYKLRHVGKGIFHCPDDAQNLTAEQTLRHNRNKRRPLVIKSRKHARVTGETPLYQTDEADLFNLILKYAVTASSIGPTGAIIAAATAESAAECGLYLRELLLQDERPENWMTTGLACLRSIGEFLLTKQYGSATGPSPSEATSSILYGAVQPGSAATIAEGSAGLTFLALYQLTSETQWLDAADRIAWYMRQLQRADLLSANGIVDSAGSPVFMGGWPQNITAAKVPSQVFLTGQAYWLWFMARYRDVRGGAYSLGTTTATGDFTSAPAGTAQDVIDAALDFYVVGRFPYSTTTSTKIAPLSSTTMQYRATANSTARFSRSTSGSYAGITGIYFALAMRGLYELEGYSARVAAIFEWFLTFTSNASFELPARTPLSVMRAGTAGTFDPSVGVPAMLALSVGQAETSTLTTNATSLYSVSATAMLGPVYNAAGVQLRTWKDETSASHCLTTDPAQYRAGNRFSSAGLSFQIIGTAFSQQPLFTLAENAMVYRAAPRALTELRGLP